MGVGYPNTPGIWSDEQTEGWKPIVHAVKKKGGHIFLQLWHVGRISDPYFLDGRQPISASAVAPTPARATLIENLLNGRELSGDLIHQAQELVSQEIHPITDIRASKEYRMHMAKVMLERGLKAAVARMAGAGPALGESVI